MLFNMNFINRQISQKLHEIEITVLKKIKSHWTKCADKSFILILRQQ